MMPTAQARSEQIGSAIERAWSVKSLYRALQNANKAFAANTPGSAALFLEAAARYAESCALFDIRQQIDGYQAEVQLYAKRPRGWVSFFADTSRFLERLT